MCSLIPVQEKLQENTGCFWVSFRHKAQSVWDYEPANYKETNGLPTSRPLLNIVCLMAVMQYLSRVMVHGTLQPVSRQSICNNHIDIITSSNGNIFRVTGPLCGEFTGQGWIPITKASDTERWCFLSFAPEQTIEQTTEAPVIWDTIELSMTSL